jgi:beta-N-acetylhexosaminidase
MGDYPARTRAALAAGCDMVLVCNHPVEAERVLIALDGRPPDPASGMRLARMHGKSAPDWATLQASEVWQQAVAAIEPLCDPTLELDV